MNVYLKVLIGLVVGLGLGMKELKKLLGGK